MEQARRVALECRKAGVRMCLLKGLALIQNGTYEISEREMEDIDLLIKKDDFAKFNNMMLSMGYRLVCSGETGYYKDGENAVIDVHTDVLYAEKEYTDDIWDSMVSVDGMKLLSIEEHFIYIMHHGLIQHGNNDKKWQKDLLKMMKKDRDWEKIKDRLEVYNLKEVFSIAMNVLDKPAGYLNYNSMKKRYIEFIINKMPSSEKGHYLRPVTARGIKGLISFGIKFLFPDLNFLRRRYRFKPAELMLFLRPFLLLLKMLQSAFFLNPFKNSIKT